MFPVFFVRILKKLHDVFGKTSACFLTILGKNLHHLFLVWNKQG